MNDRKKYEFCADEKSHERKEEIREKAKIYMKRAEELADIIKPKAQQPSIQPQQQQPSSAAKQHPQTPQTSTTTRPAYATQKSQEYVRNNSTGTSTMTTTTTTAITGTGSFGNPMNNTTLSSSVLEATFQPSQITSLRINVILLFACLSKYCVFSYLSSLLLLLFKCLKSK